MHTYIHTHTSEDKTNDSASHIRSKTGKVYKQYLFLIHIHIHIYIHIHTHTHTYTYTYTYTYIDTYKHTHIYIHIVRMSTDLFIYVIYR